MISCLTMEMWSDCKTAIATYFYFAQSDWIHKHSNNTKLKLLCCIYNLVLRASWNRLISTQTF